MSFFGFDTNLPRDRQAGQQSRGIFENPDPFAEVARAQAQGLTIDDDEIDFEDTYDGLGDQLDDDQDAFNDDTFGGGEGVGKDFDFFGSTAQISDVINEEQVRYNLQHSKKSAPLATKEAPVPAPTSGQAPSIPRLPKKTGYERYQDPGFIPEITAKSSVWGTTTQTTKPAEHAPQPAAAAPSRKMMSLEEVEAQLRQQPQHFPQPQQPMPYHELPQAMPRGPQMPFLPEAELIAIEQQALAMGIPPAQLLQRLQQMPPPGFMPGPPGPPAPLPRQPPVQPQPPPQPQPQQQPQPPRQPAAPAQRLPQQPPTGAPGLPVITDPQQLMNLTEDQRVAYLMEDAKRAKRNHKIFILSRGNGLMTPQDKNFITRIQLQQLVAATGNVAEADTESLLSEDFYYQVFSQIRGAPRQHPRQPLGHFAQTYLFQTGNRSGGHGRRQYQNADNHMQRMQQQVQRAVEAAKAKPKNQQLIIEGSLGKISFSNAKAPKTSLNIKRPEGADLKPKRATADLSASDRKSVLSNIENVYTILMKMEDLERTMPPPPDENDPNSVEHHMEWRQKMQTLNSKLWQSMKVLEPIVPGSTVAHPFIAFLSYPKGKKAIPRLFRQIDQEQRVTVLTMIVVNLDTLDVVRKGLLNPGETQLPAASREDIELFSQAVMPSLLGYVNEASFNIIIGLLGVLLAQTHVQFVARTRVGLGIMTMLLSRAAIIKEAGQADEHEWQQWIEKFNQLFDALEPGLADIFPGSINTGDDMYVWQFLAAIGIGASQEQQQRLVIAVKDRVMETVAQSKTLPPDMASQRLNNVNLFMRAIGLDVELLG
ncbi:topisomerase II associated protein (Pat1), putative [Talaromyces stipitatus ATCC 10500]|uniref:Topisomerase II associated protein (Pat1), putative n=1 Tax=Talaromyces stipitatus (strain ATCC 10500 / CBS 375.48 / QM 6759 / NRRL 1006) TaxID=441959 RepID=B8M1P2_TALSN|nr:topoisomerase II associated protein (Pat1), putative [Talaromyces stipitatus ATCC 10500]EED22129.1 topisomerase II associated protein (Pat1), putative [Talaromyces stipitatus ATCC 10500]